MTGSLLVGLAAAEIGLRLAGISYPFPWTVDTERGLALRPGAEGVWHEEGVARFRINSDGLRDGEHAVPKPPKVLRIAVLGDSFAEALQVAVEHTFWAVLERELARCPALRGRPIETVNFGVSGYATAQALITLRRKVWRYQPDIVLLAFFAGNDVEDNAPGLSGYSRRPYYRLDGDNLVLDGSFSRSLGFRLLGAIWTALIDPTIDRSRLIQLLNEARRKLRASGPQVVSAAVADAQDSARMSTPADAGKEAGLSDSVFRPPEGHAWRQAWAITEALLLMMRDEVQLAVRNIGWRHCRPDGRSTPTRPCARRRCSDSASIPRSIPNAVSKASHKSMGSTS